MKPILTKPIVPAPEPHPKPRFGFWVLLLLGIGAILLIVAQWDDADFLEMDEEGNIQLSAERQQKLEKELQELDDAEQYALVVDQAGLFPCFSCVGQTEIYLNIGEIWRYGVTTKQEQGRYGKSLLGSGLRYQIEFEGTFQECLQQEKLKIYHYATLPENLKRTKPLIRPPGNKIDR